MDMYIVLAVTIFMMVMFVWHKVPFGVTTMTCCVILMVTGCIDLNATFSGFGNKIVVLIAPMLALGNVLGKTSLVANLQDLMESMKGKHGTLLVLSIFLIAGVMAQLIPSTAVLAIMVVFLSTLGDTGEINSRRLMVPTLGITSSCKFRFPIGLGATNFAVINAMYAGIIPDEQYALKMMDPFIFSILPMIALIIYCIFGWRLVPNKAGALNKDAVKQNLQKGIYTSAQEKLIYVVFVAVMLLMILNTWTGDIMYVAPAIGVLVLIYAGVLNVKDAVASMTVDMIWMIAGVLVVSDALGSSGASELIGNAFMSIIGENPSSIMVMFLFSAVTIIVTNFLSNSATQTVLVPIAASLALVGGWDPRGIVLIAGIANMFDIALPSGSGEAAVAYGASGYNPAETLPFSIPYMIIAIITCTISAQMLFPLYG